MNKNDTVSRKKPGQVRLFTHPENNSTGTAQTVISNLIGALAATKNYRRNSRLWPSEKLKIHGAFYRAFEDLRTIQDEEQQHMNEKEIKAEIAAAIRAGDTEALRKAIEKWTAETDEQTAENEKTVRHRGPYSEAKM